VPLTVRRINLLPVDAVRRTLALSSIFANGVDQEIEPDAAIPPTGSVHPLRPCQGGPALALPALKRVMLRRESFTER
jgi:hypothetical protein